MHHGPMNPKLDMHKFDGNGLATSVAQMEEFFNLHHINDGIEKLQVTILYLDTERWWWWQWHKQCVGGTLDWPLFSKALCTCFDREDNFLGWLTKFCQTKTVREFIATFEELVICTQGLVDPFYIECFISGLKEAIQAHVRGNHPPSWLEACK